MCYSDNFGWHPMPKTLVVLGPAAYTTVPSSLIVAQGFQLWIYGEQLSAGDQWGIAKKGSACSNQEFVLKGTLDYQVWTTAAPMSFLHFWRSRASCDTLPSNTNSTCIEFQWNVSRRRGNNNADTSHTFSETTILKLIATNSN